MSLPATHLFYIQQQFSDFNLDSDFLLGNIIPDVRYLLRIPRDITHFDIKTTEELSNKIQQITSKKLPLYQKKIIVGMFCHSFHDYWWRKGVYIQTKNPFIKHALFLAEEWLSFDLLNRQEMVSKLSLIQDHSISGLDNNQTTLFVKNIILHLMSANFLASPLLTYWKKIKKLSDNDMREIISLTSSLMKNPDFVRQTNYLKNDKWDKNVLAVLCEYAIQQNNITTIGR